MKKLINYLMLLIVGFSVTNQFINVDADELQKPVINYTITDINDEKNEINFTLGENTTFKEENSSKSFNVVSIKDIDNNINLDALTYQVQKQDQYHFLVKYINSLNNDIEEDLAINIKGNEKIVDNTINFDDKIVNNNTNTRSIVTPKAASKAVIFDRNGSDVQGNMLNQPFEKGQTLSLSPNTYIRPGYHFDGWNTQADGSGASYNNMAYFNYNSDAATITLYAQWRAKTYSVSFIPNTPNGLDYSGSMQEAHFTYGVAKQLPRNEYSCKGYDFVGWNTNANGTGTPYADQAEVSTLSTTGHKTLYAQWRIKQITITFTGGEGHMDPQTTTAGTPTKLHKNTLTYPGQKFSNWVNETDNTHYKDEEVVTLYENTTLRANWIKWYTPRIYFRENATTGISGSMEPQEVDYGQTVVLNPNQFKREGYNFLGWATNADGSGDFYEDEAYFNYNTQDMSVELFAQWAPKTYRVLFNNNGGQGTMNSVAYVYDQTYTLPTCGYSKPGYDFAGWNTYINGTGTLYANQAKVKNLTITGSITLYAQWTPKKYEVTFNGNGSTSGEMSSQTFTYDKAQELRANGYEKTGYTFVGWTLNQQGTGTVYRDKVAVTNLNGGINTTLYAKWKANTYTINFNGNGATSGSMDPQTFTYDQAQELRANAFVKDGATFTTWNTQADGRGQSYANNARVNNLVSSPNGTLTLYAQWSAEDYQVVFNGNGSTSGSMSPQAFTYKENKALTTNSFEKTGYTFKGWNTNQAQATIGKVEYKDGSQFTYNTLDAVVTLYAVWQPNTYFIIFNGNNNTSGSMDNQQFSYDVSEHINANAFEKTGYTFKEWNTQANGAGTRYENKAEVSNLTATNNGTITLYAIWQANTYQVIFHGNGSTSGEMSPQTFTYDQQQALNANAFVKDGATFTTWNTQADGRGSNYDNKQNVTNLTNVANGQVDLYAQWSANNYQVIFNSNSSNVTGNTPNQEFKFGQTKNLNKNGFKKIGYTFKEWNTQADGNGNGYNDEASFNYNSEAPSITLYAIWTANVYEVYFLGNHNTSGSMEPQEFTYDQEQALNANAFIKTGYTFSGWKGQDDKSFKNNETVKNLIDEGSYILTAQWSANKYSVSFNGNGNTSGSMSNADFTYGVGKQLPKNNYVKTGYSFVGWSKEQGASEATLLDQEVVSNLGGSSENGEVVTLYAVWKAITYQLKFDGNGANDGSMASQTLTYDQSFTLPTNAFTKTGATFTGWNTKPDGQGSGYTNGSSVINLCAVQDGVVTLYAQWSYNEYQVIFDGNGNTSGSMTPQPYTYGQTKPLNPNTFSKTGYNFKGWNSNKEQAVAGVVEYQNSANYSYETTQNSVTLYAVWQPYTYYVIFNGNGNTSGNMNTQQFSYDERKALSENTFVRTGYTFVGWAKNTDGSGTTYTNEEEVSNLTDVDNGQVFLYAKWEANTYRVVFDGNGATDGTMEPQEFVYGESQELKSNAYKKTGATFIGWNTQANGAGNNYTNSQSVSNLTTTPNGEVTLYAQWSTNNYQVIFNANATDVTGNMPNQEFTYGETKKLNSNRFQKVGYEFKGWSTTSNGNVEYNNQASFNYNTENPSITLYAIWEAKTYQVVFLGNGDSNINSVTGEMSPQTMTYDQSVELADNQFECLGYTFTGWNTQANGAGQPYRNKQEVKNLTLQASISLYAQWSPNNYTVNFNGNGSTKGNMLPQEFVYNKAQKLNKNAFSKTGYTFKGWNTKQDGSGKNYPNQYVVSDLTTDANGQVTLYAQWTPNKYRIVFYGNGNTGGSMDAQEVTYDQTVTLNPNSFVKAGATFTGWNTQADGKGIGYGNQAEIKNLITQGDFALFAQWSSNKYQVIFNGNGNDEGSMSAQPFTYGESKNLSKNAFSKTGYTFTGWSTTSNGSVEYTDQAAYNYNTEDSSVTLYAIWEANTYTIKYNNNNGTGVMSDQVFKYDESQHLNQNTFTRVGYTFIGWNTDQLQANGGNVQFNDNVEVSNLTAAPNGEVTLYAVWQAIQYQIIFNGNGADNPGAMEPLTVKYDQIVNLTNNSYRKANNVFLGWNTDQDQQSGIFYANEQSVKGLSTTDGSSITLYAVWNSNTYTVIFDGNGATSGDRTTQDFGYDQAQDLIANPYQRVGYEFNGWNTKADGTGQSFVAGENVINIAKNGNIVTLYAQWIAKTYVVNFDKNTGEGTMASQTFTYNAVQTLNTNEFTKAGYYFIGWNTKADGSGTWYADQELIEDNLTVDASITLYAMWEEDLDVQPAALNENNEVSSIEINEIEA